MIIFTVLSSLRVAHHSANYIIVACAGVKRVDPLTWLLKSSWQVRLLQVKGSEPGGKTYLSHPPHSGLATHLVIRCGKLLCGSWPSDSARLR